MSEKMNGSWEKIKLSIYIVLILLAVNTFLGSKVFAEEKETQENDIIAESCTNLVGMKISKTSIGLPTTGATITSATLVLDDEKNGEYCKVLGAIHPVDSSAPDINFQVNLPSDWNQKALQMGGGGFNGSLVTGLTNNTYDPVNGPTPLARGYVTFGSDSGHVADGAWDGTFALNDEALANFAGDQIKKTHDTAMNIVKSYYQAKPAQVYFSGGSQGGREGLIAIQRWPYDYDGAVVLYPVYNFIAKVIQDQRNIKAVYENNGAGWISQEENKLINETVLKACDSLDEVKDGIISNVNECTKKSDDILIELKKAGLSDDQIKVIQTFNSSMDFDYPLANELDSMPRYSQLEGADLGGQFGTEPSSSKPIDGVMGIHADQVIRYFVMRDEKINTLTFDPAKWEKEFQAASKLIEASDPDLSTFKAQGGKLILLHGTTDQLVTPYGTIDYYEKLQNNFGDKLDSFTKFYMVPGYGHGNGEFTMSADLLGALDKWAVDGEAPSELITKDKNNDRTRPLCEYPSWPKYDGTGNKDLASNYSCSR